MWIEVKPVNAPPETLYFGTGGIIAVSPGCLGAVLVFGDGRELDVEDAYAAIRDRLAPPDPGQPACAECEIAAHDAYIAGL